MKKRIVVKIGTSTLTAGTNRISFAKIEDLARQIVQLRDQFDIILVSSGAIAAARQYVDISGHTSYADSKQAMSAIGQPKLMRLYDEIFESFGLHVAQCLMTYRDFYDDIAKENTKNTVYKLLQHGYIPIINENDTVAIEEIVLGDNDKLSALVASIVCADILLIASDIDGLFDDNPHINPNAVFIPLVHSVEDVKAFANEKKSNLGTGGMSSKIQAAEICQANSIDMWIVNGSNSNFIEDALQNKIRCTKFQFH